MIESFALTGNGDPLYYSLGMPKFWLQTSWAEMHRDLFASFQASFFEYIYIIPVWLFSNTLKAHLSAQFIHAFFSLGLGATLLYKYLRRHTSVELASLGAISLLTISNWSMAFYHAKADGAVALFSLISAILICDRALLKQFRPLSRSIVIGLSLGILPMIKMSGLIPAAVMGLVYAYDQRKQPHLVFTAAGVALLATSPILLRNWYFLKSPFFPGLVKLFPGNLTEQNIEYFSKYMSKPLTLTQLPGQIYDFLTGKILHWLAPMIALLNIKFKIRTNRYYLISLLIFAVYMAVNGGIARPRFYFACYFVTTLFIFLSISYYPLLKKHWKKSLIFILALILVDSKMDKSFSRIKNSFSLYKSAENQEEAASSFYHSARMWNAFPKTKGEQKTFILSDYASNQFYAPQSVRLKLGMYDHDAEFLKICKSSDLTKLNKFQYVLLSKNLNNPCYEKIKRSGTVIFKNQKTTLYQL